LTHPHQSHDHDIFSPAAFMVAISVTHYLAWKTAIQPDFHFSQSPISSAITDYNWL
jgi:hypothetical protein